MNDKVVALPAIPDVMKRCKRCKHNHPTGETGWDAQGVPVYGAKDCTALLTLRKGQKRRRRCPCEDINFIEDMTRFELDQEARRNESLPIVKNMTMGEVAKMFDKTGYLSPQTPLEARIAVYKLWQLPAGAKRDREFQRLICAVTMDTRAAFVRTDNKFANLVSQTDYILHAMQRVNHLDDQLESIKSILNRVLETLEEKQPQPNLKEAAAVFDSKSAPLWNEPIVTDADSTDD